MCIRDRPWEAGINGVMRQSLELILDPAQLAACQFYHHGSLSSAQSVQYHVKELYMVHWSRPEPAGVHEQDGWAVHHPPAHGLRLLRTKLLQMVRKQHTLKHERSQVLYVSRALSMFRKVHGESRLLDGLRRLVGASNLQVHYGNESLAEQVQMFNTAHLVIGADGSGLANTVFCEPGTVVLQFPVLPDLLSSAVAHIAAAVGLHFWTAPQLACLLYTSDAADEEDSVDLGGRRIIKKKKSGTVSEKRMHTKTL
eukprot:TRINITY_DN51316_c0_g1_i3.p1 TRINITY_DN51316_c0_g1~~TRINITY_DN51316_c0_g1_i3.p1  ORF type:complete len:254 (+),score=68.62 TRINITY_DN51316_c0_g1_i3:89-850(+)